VVVGSEIITVVDSGTIPKVVFGSDIVVGASEEGFDGASVVISGASVVVVGASGEGSDGTSVVISGSDVVV